MRIANRPNRRRYVRTQKHTGLVPISFFVRHGWHRKSALVGALALCAGSLFLVAAARASTTEVIYSLAGEGDGEYTDTDLVIDRAGNLYGSSVQGGNFGGGTVFQLTPS